MPKKSNLSGIAKLRSVLWHMEVDMGLTKLSQNERDVLYAFHALANASDEPVSSDAVKNESAASQMAHATFHRALAKLLELGYIEHAPNAKTKLYRLPS